jgi:hypothetical protein
MSLPDFICIGTQKAGTSWLHQMLTQNPDLWLPPLKELHFFDRMNGSEHSRQVILNQVRKLKRKYSAQQDQAEQEKDPDYIAYLDSIAGADMLSEAWYKRIFDYSGAQGKTTGEITPAYLDMPRSKLKPAIEMLPDTKFIVIIREPLSRALSQIRMHAENKHKNVVSEDKAHSFYKHLTSIKRGNYSKSIKRWNKLAGRERILYLPFSDVRDRPTELLRQIEDFLGVAHFDGYQNSSETVHKTKKIDIPASIVEEVEKMVAPQRQFLIDTFGEEFYAKTK